VPGLGLSFLCRHFLRGFAGLLSATTSGVEAGSGIVGKMLAGVISAAMVSGLGLGFLCRHFLRGFAGLLFGTTSVVEAGSGVVGKMLAGVISAATVCCSGWVGFSFFLNRRRGRFFFTRVLVFFYVV
jgi:hypothetical protein